MNSELSSEERNWAMAAHLCGLLWLAGGTGLVFMPFGGLVLFYVPSEANFLLLRVGDGRNAHRLLRDLGLLVQLMDRYGLPAFVRVSVGLPEENEHFIGVLRALGSGGRS